MAWSVPHVYTIGEALTHTLLNAELSAQLNSLRALNDVAIRVYRTSAAQAIPTGVRTPIAWQAASYQTGITWSSGTNPSRLTVPTTGIYLLDMSIRWTSTANDLYGISWHRGSAPTVQYDVQIHPGNGQDTTSGLELIQMTANDYIEISGYQESGSNKNAIGANESETSCSLSLLGTTDDVIPLWKTPRTWTDGDILSPAFLNTEFRDRLRSLRGLNAAAASVWLSKDQSIGGGDPSIITWDQANVNVGSFWDGGSGFVAPVAGLYLVTIDMEWNGSGLATSQGTGFVITAAGAQTAGSTKWRIQYQDGTANGENMAGSDLVQLAAGEKIEIFAYHDSQDDESLSLHGGADDRSRASVMLLAATS